MIKGSFKVKLFVLALVICLGVFLGLFRVYQDRLIETPVREQIAQTIKVDNVEVSKSKGTYTVEVSLQQAGDIKAEYVLIEEAVNQKIDKDYSIRLIDQRNQNLQNAYEDLQLEIYEAIAKDNYLWLDEQIKKQSIDGKYDYHLYVDDHRLYLQLKNQDGFLYEIIERPAQTNKIG